MANVIGAVMSTVKTVAGYDSKSQNTVNPDLDPVSTLFSVALAAKLNASGIGVVGRKVTFYIQEDQSHRYQMAHITPPLETGLIPWVRSGNRDLAFFIEKAIEALTLLQKPYKDNDTPAKSSAYTGLEQQKDILRNHLATLNRTAIPPLDFRYPLHKVWSESMLSAVGVLYQYGYTETLKVFNNELADVIFGLVPKVSTQEVDDTSIIGFAVASVMSYWSPPKKKPNIDCIAMMFALIGNNFLPARTKAGFVNGRLKFSIPATQAADRTKNNVSSDDLGEIDGCLKTDLDYWLARRTPEITALLNETSKSLEKLKGPYKNSKDEKSLYALRLLDGYIRLLKERSDQVPVVNVEEKIDRTDPPYCSLELIKSVMQIYFGRFQKTLEAFVEEQLNRRAAKAPINPNNTHSEITPAPAAGTSPMMMALSASSTPTPPNTPLSQAALAAAPAHAPAPAVSAAATPAAGNGT